MPIPLDFPPDDLLPPESHLGTVGQALVEVLAPALPPSLFGRAALTRLLRVAAYHDRWQGMAFHVQDRTLWAHLLTACGLPDEAEADLGQVEALLLRLAAADAWDFLAQPPTLRGPQTNPILAVVADLAPTPVYPLIGEAVQRVMLRALAEWNWPPERLPKGLLNPLSALRRVAPAFQGPLLTRFAAAWKEGDEAALVEAVWEACGQLLRLDGSDEPLAPATRKRYYYEFVTWALGLRRIAPPEESASAEGVSATETTSSSGAAVSPPHGLPQPGRRPPRPPRPAWAEEDDPPEDQAPDGYRAAAYRRAVRKALRDTAPEDAWLDDLLPAEEEIRGGLPPWLLPESRMALERAPFLWDWHALPPDGWAAVVRHTLRRRDHTALVLLTAALTGRPIAWLTAATCYDPAQPPGLGDPPAYDPQSHTLVYAPAVWARLPQQPQPADLFLPVASHWRLPLPALLAPRWREVAERTPPGQALFARTLPEQARAMLAASANAGWPATRPTRPSPPAGCAALGPT